MITVKNWEILVNKQFELDRLIIEKNKINLEWFSYFNIKRLKLALLVEVGEFANEIKSFKAWQKKAEINWVKVKEEFIDCLGYFIGLCSIYQIDFLFEDVEKKYPDLSFNDLLLDFFIKTGDLFIVTDENFYKLGATKLTEKEAITTYYNWLEIFNQLCHKLAINEQELLDIYFEKNHINQQRANEK